jgi:UDP-2,3-diacylglucosamine pyrophosphatase LpxH
MMRMKKRNCDQVICGHTHAAHGGRLYTNGGCWTELPGNYVTVKDGLVMLHDYTESN